MKWKILLSARKHAQRGVQCNHCGAVLFDASDFTYTDLRDLALILVTPRKDQCNLKESSGVTPDITESGVRQTGFRPGTEDRTHPCKMSTEFSIETTPSILVNGEFGLATFFIGIPTL